MAEQRRQDRSLSELVVRGAVEKGMDSPLRETIVEAVEESEGPRSSARHVPLAGGLLAIGAAVGYLLGARAEAVRSGGLPMESIDEPEPVADLLPDEEPAGTDPEGAPSGSWKRRILLGLGLLAAVAVARRLRSGEEAEWEPIEEFETAVAPDDDAESAESPHEETAAETDEVAEDVSESAEGADDAEESAGERADEREEDEE